MKGRVKSVLPRVVLCLLALAVMSSIEQFAPNVPASNGNLRRLDTISYEIQESEGAHKEIPKHGDHGTKHGKHDKEEVEPTVDDTDAHDEVKTENVGSKSLAISVPYLTVCAFLTFLALAIVCDDHLCPAIDVICEELGLSDDIAGATLLAFGSSAPEIFMNIAATASGHVGLSLPAILGSAIIAFGIIPPACTFASGTMNLVTWPLLRDSGMYVVSLFLMRMYLDDGDIGLHESGSLTGLYFAYLLLLFVPLLFKKASTHKYHQYHTVNGNAGTADKTPQSIKPEEEDEEALCPAFVGKFIDICSMPINFIFNLTIPSSGNSTGKALLASAVSLVWITLLSNAALETAQMASDVFGLSKTTAGATFLAAGAQIPDLFGSLALAKNGMPAGAISNAVGSQVINVSLGVGAPFLAYNLFYKKDISTGGEEAGMRRLAELLLGVIVVFWMCTLPIMTWVKCCSGQSELNKTKAGILLTVSVVVYTYFVYFQETLLET